VVESRASHCPPEYKPPSSARGREKYLVKGDYDMYDVHLLEISPSFYVADKRNWIAGHHIIIVS
jgi:hypothetical protein